MAVVFPKGETDTWQSGCRHRFEIGGHDAWIAEPSNPLPGNPWFWHFEYVDAFPDRVGTRALELSRCRGRNGKQEFPNVVKTGDLTKKRDAVILS